MRQLYLVSVDDPTKARGSISLIDGTAYFAGDVEPLFRTQQRRLSAGGEEASDEETFAFLADGWTNGYSQLTTTPPKE